MIPLKKILLISIAVGNIAFLDYQYISSNLSLAPKEIPLENPATLSTEVSSAGESASCNTLCQSLIDNKLTTLKSDVLALIPTTFKSSGSTKASPTAPQKDQTIYFGANGSTQEINWIDIYNTQLYFDPTAYSGAKTFYFEADLKSDAPDRAAFARIYDVGHGVGVQGSDLSYAGLSSKGLRSSALTFQSGKLNLRLQIHSLNGNLATLENPRLKITY